MKLLANSSYSYEIKDRSHHTVVKYLSDEKSRAAINSKSFRELELHYMRLNTRRHSLNTKKQSLSGSLFLNLQNAECLKFTTFFSPNSVTSIVSKKSTLILCILFLRRRNCNTINHLKRKQSGNKCVQKNVPIVSLLMQWEISSPESAVSENLVFWKRSSGVRKSSVFLVKFTAATRKPRKS